MLTQAERSMSYLEHFVDIYVDRRLDSVDRIGLHHRLEALKKALAMGERDGDCDGRDDGERTSNQ